MSLLSIQAPKSLVLVLKISFQRPPESNFATRVQKGSKSASRGHLRAILPPDVAVLITGKDAKKAAQDVATVKDRFPDLTQNLGQVKLPDVRERKGNKDTPTGHAEGLWNTSDLRRNCQALRCGSGWWAWVLGSLGPFAPLRRERTHRTSS